MKRRNLLVMVIALVTFFTSCKKESTMTNNTPVTPVTPNERLLLSCTGLYKDYSFEYNADKTVKSYTWGSGNYKAVFNYQVNKLVITEYDNNVKFGDLVYELSNGITQKLTSTYFAANGAVTDVYITLCNYNATGQLTRETYTKNAADNGTTDYSYDNNSDLSGLTVKDKNGIITWQTTYQYDLSLSDKSVSYGQFNSNGTGSVYPKKAKHLVKQQTATENNITKTYDYTYTLDAQGYVLTGLVKDNTNAVADNWTNAWQ